MKIRKIISLFMLSICFSLCSCGQTSSSSFNSSSSLDSSSSSSSSEGPLVYYNVQFVNYDQTLLYETNVISGGTAIYKGDTPTRPAEEAYYFTFVGWSKPNTDIHADTIFVAIYEQKAKPFKVSFVNYDNTLLDIEYVDYGGDVTYCGDLPTRATFKGTTYVFKGWDISLTNIICDSTATAQYSETIVTFTVKFFNYDDTELFETTAEYGQSVEFSGDLPTRAPFESHAYKFLKWNKDTSYIQSDLDVKAVFEETERDSSNGMSFSYDSQVQGYSVTNYCGSDSEVYIGLNHDDGINGLHPIFRIDASVFSYKYTLKTIYLDNNITTIQNSVFEGCYRLETIRLPNNLVYLGDRVFAYTALTTLDLPKYLSYIGDNVFNNCSSLENITVNEDNQYFTISNSSLLSKDETILYYIFYSNTLYYFNNGLKTIKSNCCSNSFKKNIIHLVFPSSLITIESNTFSYLNALTSVSFNSSSAYIGGNCFYGCSSLTNVSFGYNIVGISYGAFSYCTSLTNVTLPASLLSFSDPFDGCSALTSITINSNNPNFVSCSNAVFSKDYSTLNSYSRGATGTFNFPLQMRYMYCSIQDNQYSSFSISSLASYYATDSGVLYTSGFETLIASPKYFGGELTIPSNTTSINSNAFSGRNEFNAVYIKYALQTIGSDAFSNCGNLQEVSFAGSVPINRIETNAFYNCPLLGSLTLSYGITYIGSAAFSGSNLTSVLIPSSVVTIGQSAFWNSKLKQIFYCGSNASSGWSENWYNSSVATLYYYSETSNTDGIHWHYVNNVPTVW